MHALEFFEQTNDSWEFLTLCTHSKAQFYLIDFCVPSLASSVMRITDYRYGKICLSLHFLVTKNKLVDTFCF